MKINISPFQGHITNNASQANTSTQGLIGVFAVCLLYLLPGLSLATGYSVAMLTPQKIKNTTYSIIAGNRYLNNKGQVIGTRSDNSSDGIYTFGNRAVLWTNGKMQALGLLGTDAYHYGTSIPTALNDAGQVVGTSSYFVNGMYMGDRAFLWDSAKKMRRIDTDGAGFFTIRPYSILINAKGDIYGGGYYEKGGYKGERVFVTLNGKIKSLGSLGTDIDGFGISHAFSNEGGFLLNNKGQAAGRSEYYDKTGKPLGERAFLWTNNKLVNLGVLGGQIDGYHSYAVSINDNGQVVGVSSTNNGSDHAFLWTNGKMADVGVISASSEGFGSSYAIAINAVGQVLGRSDVYKGKDNTGQHGYLWFKGKMTDLGTLASGTGSSSPAALNNKGQVVGSASYSQNSKSKVARIAKEYRAFLYQNGKIVDLNTLLPKNSGWLLDNALAINDKGQITGYGSYTKGITSYKAYALLTPK